MIRSDSDAITKVPHPNRDHRCRPSHCPGLPTDEGKLLESDLGQILCLGTLGPPCDCDEVANCGCPIC
jgi:hypothetical protein